MFTLKIEATFVAHSRSISSLKFSPNGQFLASSSNLNLFSVNNNLFLLSF